MTDNNLFEIKIMKPDGIFFEGKGDFVEFTTTEGQRGVYRNHVPLTAILAPCIVHIYNNGEEKKVKIAGGFIEIQKEKITILAEGAEQHKQK